MLQRLDADGQLAEAAVHLAVDLQQLQVWAASSLGRGGPCNYYNAFLISL